MNSKRKATKVVPNLFLTASISPENSGDQEAAATFFSIAGDSTIDELELYERLTVPSISGMDSHFTMAELLIALDSIIPHSARGPDEITWQALRNLGTEEK